MVMTTNLNKLVKSTTNERLKRHGLTLVLDHDTTGRYQNMLCDEELLSVDIYSDRDAITESSTILWLSDDKVDSQINDRISNLVTQIDNSGKSAVKLTFDVTKRNLPDDTNPLIHIGREMELLLGIKPVFGSVEVDEKIGRYQVNILLNSLPYLRVINKKAIRNLYPSIHQYIGELLESGYFEMPEKERVTDLLNTDSSYERWTPLMLNALMMLLFDPIKGVHLIHVTPSTTMRHVALM